MRIFDFFTKRKQKHSVSVDAVKEQNNVLLERLEKVESELIGLRADSDCRKTECKQRDSAKDRYEERQQQMPELKSMMQTLKPSFIGAYKKNFNQLPRIASFVGTTNERHVLTDRTGSRRFLILEPDGIINVEGINHDQLYAQVLHEIEDDGRGDCQCLRQVNDATGLETCRSS